LSSIASISFSVIAGEIVDHGIGNASSSIKKMKNKDIREENRLKNFSKNAVQGDTAAFLRKKRKSTL